MSTDKDDKKLVFVFPSDPVKFEAVTDDKKWVRYPRDPVEFEFDGEALAKTLAQPREKWQPPKIGEKRSYRIGGSLLVEIEGVPPCLWCGDPVDAPSMDGPLVCACCDCGTNRDGSRWSPEQYAARHDHFRQAIDRYVAIAKSC